MDCEKKHIKEKPKKIIKAKKAISIKWPRNEFSCEIGQELKWDKLSENIKKKLVDNKVV